MLHIDAHADLYDEFEGDRFSHACPFARIMEERLAARLVQVGIRTMNAHQREQADRYGVHVIDMRAWGDSERPVVGGAVYLWSISTPSTRPTRPVCPTASPAGCRCATSSAPCSAWPARWSAPMSWNTTRDRIGRVTAVAAKPVKGIAGRMMADGNGVTA